MNTDEKYYSCERGGTCSTFGGEEKYLKLSMGSVEERLGAEPSVFQFAIQKFKDQDI